MNDLIGKEVTFGNEKFIIKEIKKLDTITLAYLKAPEFETSLNVSILRYKNKFLDELILS